MKHILTKFKIFENVQQAKSVLRKNNIPETDSNYKKIKKILSGSEGYIGWFTKMFFLDSVSIRELSALFNRIKTERQLISSLPKPIIQYEKWEDLVDDLIIVDRKSNANKIYSELTSSQKEFIDIQDPKIVDTFNKLFKMKDKENFIKKISRYKTKNDFLSALNLFTIKRIDQSFSSILNSVKRCGSKVIYEDPSQSTILCEVNYTQIRDLGYDTSWCIVKSESTFNSYATFPNKQYILFLTDLTDNFSKIGITYGSKFKTAHIKNDAYISEVDVDKITKDRGFYLGSLKVSKDEILNTLNSKGFLYYSDLSDAEFTKEEILSIKKCFYENELRYFSEKEIEENDLMNKIVIGDISKMDVQSILDNKFRIFVKVDIDYILKNNVAPRPFKDLYEADMLSKHGKAYYTNLQTHKNEILKNAWRFCSYSYDSYRGQSEEKSSVDSLIYALRYCGINSYNYYINDVLKEINLPSFDKLHRNDCEKVIVFFSESGFDINKGDANLWVRFASHFISSGYISSPIEDWIYISEYLPMIKDYVAGRIKENIKSSNYYPSTIGKIKTIFPDLYDDVSYYTTLNSFFKEFVNSMPSTRYQNYGGHKMIKNPNFNELYDKYYPILKDWKWQTGYDSEVYAMLFINILCKTKNYDKIRDIEMNYSFIGKLIRSELGTYKHNSEDYIYDTYKLSEEERKKLFDFLIMYVIPSAGSHETNLELIRHTTYSLIYYLYDWGFDRFCDYIKSIKENFKKYNEKPKTLRIYEFRHILSYLFGENKWEEGVKLIKMVLGWKMTKPEKILTEKFIKNFTSTYYMIDKKEYIENVINKIDFPTI